MTTADEISALQGRSIPSLLAVVPRTGFATGSTLSQPARAGAIINNYGRCNYQPPRQGHNRGLRHWHSPHSRSVSTA